VSDCDDGIKQQNLESRAKNGALCKDPHLRSSPILGEGKREREEQRAGSSVGQLGFLFWDFGACATGFGEANCDCLLSALYLFARAA
jgi:hypothetical protein